MAKKTSARIQLYLEAEQYQFLVREAKVEGSVAAVVRNLIDKKLKGKKLADDALAQLVDLAADGGPSDLSTKHDQYLYGKPGKRSR